MRAFAASCLFLFMVPAASACDVKAAGIEEAIAAKKEFREAGYEQFVTDVRSLRDAAIVLEAYKQEAACQQLVAIVKGMLADPAKSITQGGDTDEDSAEEMQEAQEPKPSAKPK